MHFLTFLTHTIVAIVLLSAWGFAVVMVTAHLKERFGRDR